MYGRAAGKDGVVPDVREPDAELHLCPTRGLGEAHHDWKIRSDASPPSI